MQQSTINELTKFGRPGRTRREAKQWAAAAVRGRLTIFFPSRAAARAFAKKRDAYRVVDKGPNTTQRWGVQVS